MVIVVVSAMYQRSLYGAKLLLMMLISFMFCESAATGATATDDAMSLEVLMILLFIQC